MNRFERQRDLVPAERLREVSATLIGVGAVGRQVALQLTAIGIPKLQLIDFDSIDLTNITTQGYRQVDLGRPKIEATCEAATSIDPAVQILCVPDRFRSRYSVQPAVFCCVDSIASRASIWRAVKDRCALWVDGRMLGETIRVFTASDETSRQHYSNTLFDQSEAQAGRCTAHSTIYTANIAAGLMIHQFTRWLRGIRCDAESTMNLLASEWTSA